MKRVLATLVVTGLGTAYIVWKIDLGKTGHVLAHARAGWWLLSLGIMAGSVWPMAWRWQRLLAARGVHERLSWLVRAYFVGYAAGQVLPTSLGGDASRIYETVRRHEGAGGAAAGTVLLERALGGVATLLLAAVGFALAVAFVRNSGGSGPRCARCGSTARSARSTSRCTPSAATRRCSSRCSA